MLRRRSQEKEFDPLIEQSIEGTNALLTNQLTHLFEHGNRVARLFNLNAQVIWTSLLERTRENQELSKKLDELYAQGIDCSRTARISGADIFKDMLRRSAGRR